ncbi:MAG TPA: response regulator transcription factor [Candidatus Krumholzibacteria bacterium]|nr:response regulator transcription factor [Candidatus Krumholzibacteria bacterium]
MAATAQRVSGNVQQKVLIVDDHPIVREGIAQIISRDGGLEVCGEADCPEKALQLVATSKPDVAIVDLEFSIGSGLGLIRDLKVLHPRLPVLVLSMHDETIYAERVLRVGASGYIMKHEVAEHFVEAIRSVLRGGIYLSERMAARMLLRLAGKEPGRSASAIERLSDRELEVLQLIAQALTTREVAERLYLSITTVETHLERVKRKLGLESSRELFRYAIVWSLERF